MEAGAGLRDKLEIVASCLAAQGDVTGDKAFAGAAARFRARASAMMKNERRPAELGGKAGRPLVHACARGDWARARTVWLCG